MYFNVSLHLGLCVDILFAGLLCPLIFCPLFLIIEEDCDFSLGFYILRTTYCLFPSAVIRGEVWKGLVLGSGGRQGLGWMMGRLCQSVLPLLGPTETMMPFPKEHSGITAPYKDMQTISAPLAEWHEASPQGTS